MSDIANIMTQLEEMHDKATLIRESIGRMQPFRLTGRHCQLIGEYHDSLGALVVGIEKINEEAHK